MINYKAEVDLLNTPKPYSEWCEKDGNVLWAKLPVVEPSYCGSPDSSDWPYLYEWVHDLYWVPLSRLFRGCN